MDTKQTPDTEKKLDQALRESFPASDANSTNEVDAEPVRPVHRKPAEVDQHTVDKLAEQVKRRHSDK